MILAIDPGLTVGIAYKVGAMYLTDTIKTTINEVPEELIQILMNHQPDLVLLEDFDASGRNSRYATWTCQLIGIVRAVCHLTHTKCVLRKPGQRLIRLSKAEAILKERTEPFEEHQKDALAHILSWERDEAI